MAISLRGVLKGLSPGQLSGPYGGFTSPGLNSPSPVGIVVNESESELAWEDQAGNLVVEDSAYYVGGQGASNLESVATCVRIITDTLNAIPLFTVDADSGDRVETVLDDLLRQPNGFVRWRQTLAQLVQDYLLFGEAFLYVERQGRRPTAVWHLPAGRVDVKFDRENGALIFDTQGNRIPNVAGEPPNVAYFCRQPQPSFPPRGTSVIRSLRNVVGYGLVADAFLERNAEDGRHRMALKAPGTLNENQRKAIGEAWKRATTGAKNWHRTPLLESGVEPVPLTMSSADMQMLDQLKLSRLRIASAFSIPPIKLNDLDKASFANAAQQERAYLKNAVLPILGEFQDVLHRAVLNGAPEFRVEYDLDPVARAEPMELVKIKMIESKIGARTPRQIASDLGYPDDEFEEPEPPPAAGVAPKDPPSEGGDSPAAEDPK